MGAIVWRLRNRHCLAATKTQDGGYLLAGDSRSNDLDVTDPKGNADVWLVKIDDQGNLLWQKNLGGSNFESARAIIPYGTGYALTGGARSADGDVTANNGQNDIWVVTIDQSGNLLKQQSFGGNNQDFGYGIATSQNSIIIVGDTQSSNGDLISSNGGVDAVLIKLQ